LQRRRRSRLHAGGAALIRASHLFRAAAIALLVAAAPAFAQVGQIAVTADGSQTCEETPEGFVCLVEDNVVIHYQDVKIQADEVTYNRTTGDVHAIGNVIVDRGPERFAADELHYNLSTKVGQFINGSGSAPPSYHFSGQVLEQIDETHFRIVDGTFTSCETEGTDPWDLRMKEAVIEREGYGRFKNVRFRVRRAPILYFPYMIWPVKQERSPGLLMPNFGFSERRGFYLGNIIYFPLGRSYDTTLFVDLFTEGYYGLGSEWRWAPSDDAFGEILGYAINDPEGNTWQWKLDGEYRDRDLWGFSLQSEIHHLSDADFFQEFENDFNQNTRRSLYSHITMTRSWGPATMNLRTDRRVTFLSSDDVVLQQLPEAEMRIRSNRIGRSDIYWSLISSLNVLDVDRGGDLKGTYGRADLFPEISYTLPGAPWLTVTPNLGGRVTWYSKRYAEDRRSFEETPIDRTFFKGGVDIVGPSFSRIFRLGGSREGTKVKHLVEPRLEYRYLSDPGDDSSLIPVFDEVDSTFAANRVRATLSNRLFIRSPKQLGARELLSLDLFQEYSFSDPLNSVSGDTSQYGPLGASLRVVPAMGSSIDARVSYDTLTSNLRSTSVSANMSLPVLSAGLTWFAGYSPTTGDQTSSQAQVRFGYRKPDFPVHFDVHVAYDLENSDLQQQSYKIKYQGDCWGIGVEYRDLRSVAFPARDYRVVISLKGLGELPAIRGSFGPGGG
jgi:LPS-assembly protein